MFSVRNIVIVALMQMGVIIAGILAAGLCHKVWLVAGVDLPWPAALIYHYGFMGLFIPTGWSVATLFILYRPEVMDEVKGAAFWQGVLTLVLLVIFVVYADVSPWLHRTWSLTADGSE